MNCILPRELLLSINDGHDLAHSATDESLDIGGWERGAVVFDCDGRWDVAKLRHMLSARLLDEQHRIKGSDLTSIVEEQVQTCLKRIHIFKPRSTLSMACTILQLPKYHAQCMGSLDIALLVIDSVSSFYWQGRLDVEQQRNAEKKEPVYPMDRFLIALQDFRLIYGSVIVMTNWGLSSLSNQGAPPATEQPSTLTAPSGIQQDGPSPFYRQHLHPFPSPFEFPARVLANAHLYPPITHHITLSLPPMPLIPSEIRSLEEAERIQKSWGAVDEVVGILRLVSSGTTGNFTMKIGPNGITS